MREPVVVREAASWAPSDRALKSGLCTAALHVRCVRSRRRVCAPTGRGIVFRRGVARGGRGGRESQIGNLSAAAMRPLRAGSLSGTGASLCEEARFTPYNIRGHQSERAREVIIKSQHRELRNTFEFKSY